MGLICGWLGEPRRNQGRLLEAMISKSLAPKDSDALSSFHSTAAAGSSGIPGHHSACVEEGICCAIEGHPRWTEPELHQVARSKGHAIALAKGYRRYGSGLLQHLHGAFALAILDPSQGHALLAVDRMGIRPLAFATPGGTLVFGSQLFSILAHPEVSTKLSLQGIFNYLYFHMAPSPDTVFEGLRKLQPAEFVEYKEGRIHRDYYWRLEFSETGAASKDVLAGELHDHLRQSVSGCVDDPLPAGTFLSGGLDSSTVTGVLRSLQKNKVDAYAIGFDAEGFDEMEYARATARHFGVNLHEYYVTPQDVLDAIPMASRAYDEPFGNASAIPAYHCAKLAREQGKTALLAGDGGDEIFAGNARYAKQKVFDLYRHVPPLLKTALIEPLAYKLPPLRKVRSYIEQSRIPMPERMETYNFLHRFALNEIFSNDFLQQVDTEEPLQLLRERWNQCGEAPLVKQMLFLDHKFTLADNDLRKVNRMCELAGIDVRYPLLQEEMVEFAARIPANLLLRGQKLRAFYRHAMKDFLPQKTLEKHKHGFGLPFGLWMNEYQPLKDFAHDRLERIKARGLLNDDFIRKIIEAQETGHATYYGVFIWVLIMLEEWLETHKEKTDLTV